jgi:hypothetical protein
MLTTEIVEETLVFHRPLMGEFGRSLTSRRLLPKKILRRRFGCRMMFVAGNEFQLG